MSLCLRVADLSFRVATRDSYLRLGVTHPTDRFVVDEVDRPDLDLEALWMEPGEREAGRWVQRFDSAGIWKLYEGESEFRFEFATPKFGEQPYKVATVDKAFTRGRVELTRDCVGPDGMACPLEYPLDELLAVSMLGRGLGVELHACGLVDEDGRGFLFAGMSGAGKSTTTGLFRDKGRVEVLSDDRIIVRKLNGRFWMYGTPWHGDARSSAAAGSPIHQLLILRQGPTNSFDELSPSLAAAELFARSFPVFYDPAALDFSLRFLAEMAASCSCQRFTFTRDPSAVDFVRQRAA